MNLEKKAQQQRQEAALGGRQAERSGNHGAGPEVRCDSAVLLEACGVHELCMLHTQATAARSPRAEARETAAHVLELRVEHNGPVAERPEQHVGLRATVAGGDAAAAVAAVVNGSGAWQWENYEGAAWPAWEALRQGIVGAAGGVEAHTECRAQGRTRRR
jgi:hypothetical protein